MKKILALAIVLIIFLTSCGEIETYKNRTINYEIVPATVTHVYKHQYYASTIWYNVEITVETDDGLSETLWFKGQGAFGCPPEWDIEEGDVLDVEVEVISDNGEIISRDITGIE